LANRVVISSDSHVVEPPNLWLERMDPKYGDRIPHLVKGVPYDQWYCDGLGVGAIGIFSMAGLRFENPGDITSDGSYADVPAGGYDPHAHVADLDVDKVKADVIYPSIGLNMYAGPDGSFIRQVFSAYNDWLSEFCQTYPDRLKGIAMILLDDEIDKGIDELIRAHSMGMCGAMISVYPRVGETYDHPDYDSFWKQAENLQMPISLHNGTKRSSNDLTQTSEKVQFTGAEFVNRDHWVRMSISQIVLSGVFERYPNLNIVNVEHELAWIPYFLRRLDVAYLERSSQTSLRFKNAVLPSDVMRSNVYHSFQDDELGIRDRHDIGVDKLLWASDYPHAESTFPRSQAILEEILEGVPEDEKNMIVAANTAKLYKFE